MTTPCLRATRAISGVCGPSGLRVSSASCAAPRERVPRAVQMGRQIASGAGGGPEVRAVAALCRAALDTARHRCTAVRAASAGPELGTACSQSP